MQPTVQSVQFNSSILPSIHHLHPLISGQACTGQEAGIDSIQFNSIPFNLYSAFFRDPVQI
uniref:Uncharacterized protein n=1 Tax=Anguilla anguilla TaxID=7936 RepID=A0A0E9VZJ1_ANGAN